MIAKMKMGLKGQVVIPKHFRDDFGLKPGGEVIVDYDGRELVLKKPASNIVEIAELIAKSGKKVKVSIDSIRKAYLDELEERYARIHRQ